MVDGYEHHYRLAGKAFEPGGAAYPARLMPEEVEPYLVERLRAVGWQGRPILDLALAPLLYEATGGDRDAIDSAMTALLDQAARADSAMIEGDSLAAWIDQGEPAGAPAPAAGGLAEAQLAAIEQAFAEQERKLTRMKRELAELRDTSTGTAVTGVLAARLEALEARQDQQDAALRHILERLIAFFEEGRG